MPPNTLGAAGAGLIRHFEGCGRRLPDGRYIAYPDPATGGAPWTIGWGSTGPDIKQGTIWTQEQCDARLAANESYFSAHVAAMLGKAPTTANQFDALVDFAYNVGLDENRNGIAEGLGDSTLLKKHLAGDYTGARAEFAKWNKAAGAPLLGLTRRRAAEAALYATTGPANIIAIIQQIGGSK
jgi:GH24 family phage-related lysozyme (muramidase)